MAKKGVKFTNADGTVNAGHMKLLLENSIELQKTITNLALELKTLNKKVSSLLNLFEDANKAFQEAKSKGTAISTGAEGTAASEELLKKLNDLIKQNKTIARGIILLERTIKEDKEERTEKKEYKPKPLPEFAF